MRNYSLITLIASFLCFSVTFMGCYSYFPVQENDFSNVQQDKKVRIVLKDGREFIVSSIHAINFSTPDKIEFLNYDNTLVNISLTEVEGIYQERFDYAKTFFSGMWITIGLFVILLLMFLPNGGNSKGGIVG